MVAGTRRCAAMHSARSFFLYSFRPRQGLRESAEKGERAVFLYRARGSAANKDCAGTCRVHNAENVHE